MNKRGFISVIILWVLAALAFMSLPLLRAAHWQQHAARFQLNEQQALARAQAAAVLAYKKSFAFDDLEVPTEEGRVHLKRLPLTDTGRQTLRCSVRLGDVEKNVECTWEKYGNHWRLTTWKEVPS